MLFTEREQPVPEPLGDEVERALLGVQQPGALDVRVVVDGLDEARSLFVRSLGDGAHDRFHSRLGLDREDLARLDVGAEADGERGETVESLLIHGWEDTHGWSSGRSARLPRD